MKETCHAPDVPEGEPEQRNLPPSQPKDPEKSSRGLLTELVTQQSQILLLLNQLVLQNADLLEIAFSKLAEDEEEDSPIMNRPGKIVRQRKS